MDTVAWQGCPDAVKSVLTFRFLFIKENKLIMNINLRNKHLTICTQMSYDQKNFEMENGQESCCQGLGKVRSLLGGPLP